MNMSLLEERSSPMKRWLRPWRQWMWMILFAALLGLVVNEFRTDRLVLFADWSIEARLAEKLGEFSLASLDEAQKLFYLKRAVFVDARPPEAYRGGHIFGARNLAWGTAEDRVGAITAGIPPEAIIIVYCDGEDCMLSEYVARDLFYRGYDHVKVFVNGWTKWVEAGLPIGHQTGVDEEPSG